MRFHHQIYSFAVSICLLTIILAQSALSQTDSDNFPSIPSAQQGLFVNAICGKGCDKPMQPCNVFVLTESEYQDHINNKSKIESKGKTPLFIKGLKSRIYYVAVDAPVNTETVPMTGGSFSPLKPDYQGFFIDDLPDEMHHVLSSVPAINPSGKKAFRVVFTFRKWYKIAIEKDSITPIIAIFLDKQSSLADWEKFYPKKKNFKIIPGTDFQMEFLDAVEKSSGVSIENRKLFLDLLRRGGRVCVPQSKSSTIVSINSKGLPEARSILGTSSIAENPENVTAITPNRRISAKTPFGTTTAKNDFNKLPKYEMELQGSNEVRIVNPNAFDVVTGLRSSNKGKNYNIPAASTHSVFVPDGNYDVYFVYSNEPDALYQGESFTLRQNGVEIQIVKVVGGNYAIRRVK